MKRLCLMLVAGLLAVSSVSAGEAYKAKKFMGVVEAPFNEWVLVACEDTGGLLDIKFTNYVVSTRSAFIVIYKCMYVN